jgi:hypothetical protein
MSWQYTKQIINNNYYSGGAVNSVGTAYGTTNIGTSSDPIIVLDISSGDNIFLSGSNPVIISEKILLAQYYKTIAQPGTGTGTNSITFDAYTPWSDTNYIYQTVPYQFYVNQNAIYRLTFTITNLVGTGFWNANESPRVIQIVVLRGVDKYILRLSQFIDSAPEVDQFGSVSDVIELQKGDTIECELIQYLQGGNTSIEGKNFTTLDYNTTFTWELVKSL